MSDAGWITLVGAILGSGTVKAYVDFRLRRIEKRQDKRDEDCEKELADMRDSYKEIVKDIIILKRNL